MPRATEAFKGRGAIYLERIGSGTGLISVGNCDNFTINYEEETDDMKDYQGPSGGIIATESSISDVVAELNLMSFTTENLALVMRGVINVINSEPITLEEHTANSGALIPFDKIPDSSIPYAITDSGATTTYVLGTDYTTTPSGIEVLATGSITDGSTVEVNYTCKASAQIEALAVGASEYRLYFDGFNTVDDTPFVVDIFKIKVTPSEALAWITDNGFATMSVTTKILKDDTKTGLGVSPYYIVKK